MKMLDLDKIQDKTREEVRKKIDKFEKQWKDFLSTGQVIKLKKGQIVFYEGHFPCGVFILLSGKVAILSQEDQEQDEIMIPLYQTIGIDLMLTGQPYPFTAVCKTDVITLFLSKTILQETLNLVPLTGNPEEAVILKNQ